MNDLYAIVPASAIILIIALRKVLAPVQFNEEIFGEIHPDEVNNSASMRMMIGAGFGGIGLMGLMLGFMLEAGEATTSLLYALAAAYGFMLATLLFANQKTASTGLLRPTIVGLPNPRILPSPSGGGARFAWLLNWPGLRLRKRECCGGRSASFQFASRGRISRP